MKQIVQKESHKGRAKLNISFSIWFGKRVVLSSPNTLSFNKNVLTKIYYIKKKKNPKLITYRDKMKNPWCF